MSDGRPDDRPPDRTSFIEFQARNRRATWRLGAICALVVGGGGALSTAGFLANLVLVLFALVFVPSLLLLGLWFLAGLSPATAALREPLWGATQFVLGGLHLLVGFLAIVRPATLGGLALLLSLGCWVAVRSVWLVAGVGETLLAMGAREPAPGDPEEHQLVNVVQEMAIAAGIPPPQVRLLDAQVANAAVAGTGTADAYVVVGRRLLDEFDRDETQGVLGHLIGSIGNGDLRGAAQIHAMLYVLELSIVVVLAPFARFPRQVAARWLAFPLRAGFLSRERRAEEARALIQLLRAHRGGGGDPEHLAPEYLGPVGRVLFRLCPPLIALIAFSQAATGFLLLFASLPVALLWRSRRYLADATAVALTRNPTGLYRGLSHLAECGAVIPGGEAVSHLFIVGPEARAAREAWRRKQAFARTMERLRAQARAGRGQGATAPASGLARVAEARATFGELHQQDTASRSQEARAERGTLSEREGLLMGMHPSVARRLARLVLMGAVPPNTTTPPV